MKTLNETELRKICECSACGKGVMNTGLPLFWHLKVSRYGIKMQAVNRQAGMEMFMGGNVPLAQVFSAGEDLAERLGDEVSLSFCEDCMLKINYQIMALCEKEVEDG